MDEQDLQQIKKIIDASNEESLTKIVKPGFDGVDKKFDGVDKKFDGVDKKFDKVDKRFDEVDERLDKMGIRLHKVEVNVDQIKKKMVTKEELDEKLEEMRNWIIIARRKENERVDALIALLQGKGMVAEKEARTLLQMGFRI